MSELTEGEKLIWAATYAAEWSRQIGRKESTGIEMYVAQCVERAWAAVEEARDSHSEVKEGWGEDGNVYSMLTQMTAPARS